MQVLCQGVARTDLEPWKILRLDSAHTEGKRHVKVRYSSAARAQQQLHSAVKALIDKICRTVCLLQIQELAKDLQMDRADVLQWLKEHSARSDQYAVSCSCLR